MIEITPKKSGRIVIDNGGLSRLPEYVKSLASRFVIVTDDNVAKLHLPKLRAAFEAHGDEVFEIIIQSGEAYKNFDTYQDILSKMGDYNVTREDAVIAFGGGVVGDVAGFAAATYKRGIPVIQVPTTLLSAIDSSIGGKTGIDTNFGKNSVGAFHMPSLTLVDASLLASLPDKQWKNGLGEAVKYAVLMGGEMMDILRDGLPDDFTRLLALCAEYKANIVDMDERDNSNRRLLNLGHTVGHAIEQMSGYSIQHGEAVAQGLYAVARGAAQNGSLSSHEFGRIEKMLTNCGFDLTISFTPKQLASAIALDKKCDSHGNISFVDIVGVGDCVVKTVKLSEFAEYILW